MFVHKTLLECSYLILIMTSITLMKSYGVFIDYNGENTELIQQRAGYDIKLQCGIKGLIDEDTKADIKIHWYFKQCSGNSAGRGDCHDFYEDSWTQLPCEENFCKIDLLLRNVTEKYSGLYKCIVYPYRLDDGNAPLQLVRTYQLDVKNTSMTAPVFLDAYPLNKTSTVGAQVVFQCRVHSEVHPTVKWFRRIPELSAGMEYTLGNENFNSHIVRYNGQTYELLPTAREKFISNDIYLSKLILNGVRLQDEGHYACVAISYRGHRIREAYLQVFASDEEEYWMEYETSAEASTDPREFWLLFLMPFGLAMLPITVWLCYAIYKRCKVSTEVKSMEPQYFDEETNADRCMLRT